MLRCNLPHGSLEPRVAWVQVPLDPEAIDSKVRQEIEAEAAREGARRYQPPGVAAA